MSIETKRRVGIGIYAANQQKAEKPKRKKFGWFLELIRSKKK